MSRARANTAKESSADKEDARAGLKDFHVNSSMIVTSPQIARDLEIMNLPKTASLTELKKQYHKFGTLLWLNTT